MTDFLIRRFIKRYHRTEDADVRRQYNVLACTISALCDILMFLIKLLMGMFTGSSAILADSYNNLASLIRIILGFLREKIYKEDEENKKKHRADYIVTIIVAFIIFEIGFSFFRNAFTVVFKAKEIRGSLMALVFMAVIIAIKIFLSSFELKIGRIVKREDMLKAAITGRREITVTLIAFLAMLITWLTPINLDSIATLFTAVMVMWSAICVARDIINPLIKEESDSSMTRSIKNGVMDYSGVIGVHDIVIRNYGKGRIAASLYADVSVDEDVGDARQHLDDIEKELGRKLGIELVIHMNMVETDDIASLKARMSLEKILSNIDERLSFSDFHLLKGAHVKNLIFDLNIPYDYNNEDKRDLEDKINRRVTEVDPVYACVINMQQNRK